MLIVITLVTVIVGLIGVCLSGIYRAELRTRQLTICRTAISQLSLRLRTDAHESLRAELAEQPGQGGADLTLIGADGRTIAYRAEAQQVERTVRKDGHTLHHDAFRLPGVRVAWQLQTEIARPLATAVISHLPEPGVKALEPVREERLEAVVGLHVLPRGNTETP
jgi:hypothetical protein